MPEARFPAGFLPLRLDAVLPAPDGEAGVCGFKAPFYREDSRRGTAAPITRPFVRALCIAHILCGWETGSLLPAGLVPRRAHPRPACKETCTAASSPGSGRGPSGCSVGDPGGRLERNPFVPAQGRPPTEGWRAAERCPLSSGGQAGPWPGVQPAFLPRGAPGCGLFPGKSDGEPRSRTPRVTERTAGGRSPRRQHSERLATPATRPRWPPLVRLLGGPRRLTGVS